MITYFQEAPPNDPEPGDKWVLPSTDILRVRAFDNTGWFVLREPRKSPSRGNFHNNLSGGAKQEDPMDVLDKVLAGMSDEELVGPLVSGSQLAADKAKAILEERQNGIPSTDR